MATDIMNNLSTILKEKKIDRGQVWDIFGDLDDLRIDEQRELNNEHRQEIKELSLEFNDRSTKSIEKCNQKDIAFEAELQKNRAIRAGHRGMFPIREALNTFFGKLYTENSSSIDKLHLDYTEVADKLRDKGGVKLALAVKQDKCKIISKKLACDYLRINKQFHPHITQTVVMSAIASVKVVVENYPDSGIIFSISELEEMEKLSKKYLKS